MNNQQLQLRVRSMTRDLSGSIFRQVDVQDYINEGIDRVRQVIPQLNGMIVLSGNNDVPNLMPDSYHYLLSVYSASRCFFQDERHYQATNLMNEFESKLDELKNKIESGDVIIKDGDGNTVEIVYPEDYVEDNYYLDHYGMVDVDEGVEGV